MIKRVIVQLEIVQIVIVLMMNRMRVIVVKLNAVISNFPIHKWIVINVCLDVLIIKILVFKLKTIVICI